MDCGGEKFNGPEEGEEEAKTKKVTDTCLLLIVVLWATGAGEGRERCWLLGQSDRIDLRIPELK